MSARLRKGIAFGLLGATILATLTGLLPAQGIDWVYLGGFVLLGVAASVQGRSADNMAFLTAAALLIQGGINILELWSLTKLVNGAFFVLAVVRLPDGFEVLVKKKKRGEADGTQAPPQGAPFASGVGSGGAGGGSGGKTADQARRAQAVFEEFQAFTLAHEDAKTQEHEQGQKAAGDAKAQEDKKPRGSGKRRGRHKSDDGDRHRSKPKGRPRSGTSSGKPSRPRSTRDEEATKAAKPARGSHRSSGRSSTQEARDRLQAEQHALQREKERLAEEARLAERKRRQEEERLKRERAALAKEREALKAQPAKPNSKPDTRSPEAVLGINSATYTFEELKAARKREAARWHPSSMQHKPKELIDMAEEELKKINLAYDKLKKKFE